MRRDPYAVVVAHQRRVQATAGADEIRALGRQLLDGLDGPARTVPDGPERR